MIAPMAAPRPPPNTPPMIAPVAPPTIAPPTGSCAAASCIGIATAMARQAEDPKARINPVLLLIEMRRHSLTETNGVAKEKDPDPRLIGQVSLRRGAHRYA